MVLPILHPDAALQPGDLIRYFCRTQLHWTRHLADEADLGFGTAFANRQLAGVWDANRILEVALPEGVDERRAWQEAGEYYQRAGTACRQWVMLPGAEASRRVPMVRYLLDKGFTPATAAIMYLRHMRAEAVAWPAGLKVIGARASFRHARLLAEQSARRWGEEQLVEAAMLHLDDPHWDALIGLRDGVAVARAGVLAVGDCGLIEHVFVAEPFRRQGIGRLMISRVLEICGRARFKHVFLEVDEGNTAALELYRRFGFETIGQITAYCAPGQRSRP